MLHLIWINVCIFPTLWMESTVQYLRQIINWVKAFLVHKNYEYAIQQIWLYFYRLGHLWKKTSPCQTPLFICHAYFPICFSSSHFASVPFLSSPSSPPPRINLSHMRCSLRSSYLSLCQHISSHVCLSVPLLPFQVHLPSHPLFNALCVLQIVNSHDSRHHSFHFSTRPVSDDERRKLPSHTRIISVIFIPSAQLCFAMYLQYMCLPPPPRSAVLCLLFVAVKCAHWWLAAISGGEDEKKPIWQKVCTDENIKKFALFHSVCLLSLVPCLRFSFFCHFMFFNKRLVMMYLCCLSL